MTATTSTGLRLDAAIDKTLRLIDGCATPIPGRYKRLRAAPPDPQPEWTDPYGTSNVVNLLTTMNLMPDDPERRLHFGDAIATGQDPETGLFVGWPWTQIKPHHPIHSTAHSVAALRLLARRPNHPLRALEPYATPDGIVGLLESLDWIAAPWGQSHLGAGAYAALRMAHDFESPAAADAWEDAYFDWLTSNFDPDTGLLRRGALPGQVGESKPIFHHVASTFHYLFNFENARRPLPYPEAMIDTLLAIHAEDAWPGLPSPLGFVTIDWVYCVTRPLRQCGHRYAEARAALIDVAHRLHAAVETIDDKDPEAWPDLHQVLGTWSAFAELQQAIPGLLRSPQPLQLVLDRRPFI
ncbi:MAG: hypothetical protein AAF823_07870 [Planctomycetota bacterium]